MRRSVVAFVGLMAFGLAASIFRVGNAQSPDAALAPVYLDVTGDPAPIETQRLAILTATRALVPEARSGRVALSETTPPLQPLPAAAAVALRAVVQVAPATGTKPVIRTVPVELRNETLPWADAGTLLVSNSPETLPFGKVLLSGSVAAGQTVRLLYHHANGSSAQRMTIALNLSNPDRAPITVWVTGAAGNSWGDELALGHAAARAFLEQYWHRAGFVLHIPANTTLPLFLHELAPGAIASGLTQFALIEGDRLNVQVTARLEGELDPPPASYPPNFDKVHQRGMFERPQLTRALTYTVGDSPLSMSVGEEQDALHESLTGTPLGGNYGVIYTFPVEVNNPSQFSTVLGLVMQAASGQASGTILVDDRIVDIVRVPAGERRLVTTIRIAPGEHRTVLISMMPESGGYYPVRFSLGTQYQ